MGLLAKHNPQTEAKVYTWLCIGIVYSLVYWTLLNSILCLALSAYWLFFSRKSFNISTIRSRMVVLFSLLYIVSGIGMLYTSNIEEGWFRMQQRIPLLLFPIVLGTSSALNDTAIKKICYHFVAATSIACLASFVYKLFEYLHTGNPTMITGHDLIIFPDLYPYILGLFCNLCIIIILQALPECSPGRTKWLLALIVFLSLFILLLSTRTIIACWMIVILFFVFRYLTVPLHRVLVGLTMIFILVTSGAAIPSLGKQWKELINFSNAHSIQLDKDASLNQSWGGKAIRVAIWNCSMDVVREHWLTGVGTGDIQDSLQTAYENRKFFFASRYNRYNTHDQYLQILVGHGIGGLAVFLLCLIVPVFYLKGSPFRNTYLLFLLLFAIGGVTEVMLDVNKGIVWYSFFNSIFVFRKPD